jgi:glutamyl-tRNA reductase
MEIVAVGVNHRTAHVEVRERLAMVREELPEAHRALWRIVPSGVILSTCNRTEVYGLSEDGLQGSRQIGDFLAAFHQVPQGELAPYLYSYEGAEAVRHLFSVASGIDSMILGETEILGQVREALVTASMTGPVSLTLSRLFHHAMRTGRRARVETEISRHALSVSHAAVQMAKQVFDGLAQCRVLVISAGEAGKLTAKSLRDAGAKEIGVANRTRDRAAALAAELGGRVVDFEALGEALIDYDIVISATASARFVIPAEMVNRAMEHRGDRALCLIDIAVPRDIDPASRKVRNVYLYDIDDLEAISLANRKRRQKEVGKVESIVREETDRFMEWASSLDAVPVIATLREKADAIRTREVAKAMRKLGHLSQSDREQVEALAAALTRKLLDDPINVLREQGQNKEYIDSAKQLFRLEETESRAD